MTLNGVGSSPSTSHHVQDASTSNENADLNSTSTEPEWQPEAFQTPEVIVDVNQDRTSTYGIVNQVSQYFLSQGNYGTLLSHGSCSSSFKAPSL